MLEFLIKNSNVITNILGLFVALWAVTDAYFQESGGVIDWSALVMKLIVAAGLYFTNKTKLPANK